MGVAPHKIWIEALDNLAHYGGLRRLCELVAAQYPYNNVIQNAIQAVINAQVASEVRMIKDNVLFINRTNLRDQLKLLRE